MYKLEIWENGKIIKSLLFMVNEFLELLQYKRKYQQRGCTVKVYKEISTIKKEW